MGISKTEALGAVADSGLFVTQIAGVGQRQLRNLDLRSVSQPYDSTEKTLKIFDNEQLAANQLLAKKHTP
jgi:hypothetical protein